MKKTSILFLICAISFSLPTYSDPHVVGARHQNTFEVDPNTGDPWRDESNYRDDICGGFVVKMTDYSDVDDWWFVGDLYNANSEAYFIEGWADASTFGVDNTDIHMTCTHSGAWGPDPASGRPAAFTMVMYHRGTRAFSHQMRLGDDARKTELFVLYGCESMKPDDYITTRWRPVFEGGLKYAASFWGAAYPNSGAKNLGKTYAKKLHESGYSFRYAWLDSIDDYSGNTPAVMATGQNTDNCYSRLGNMNLSNFRNASVMPRIRDSSIGRFCWTRRQG
jgi:hypothetical protein